MQMLGPTHILRLVARMLGMPASIGSAGSANNSIRVEFCFLLELAPPARCALCCASFQSKNTGCEPAIDIIDRPAWRANPAASGADWLRFERLPELSGALSLRLLPVLLLSRLLAYQSY